ncbi:MAG TPA: ATP-binding protein, partial [Candidatus Tectomicrobia bacterium]|nr:ATP-binding protein [Candidatus Tectomicrobia bacterium]
QGHRHHPHHRVAGRTGRRTAVVTTRPRRAPHHPISDVGVIGGCSLPGEGSRAHHGILGLDTLPECRRHVLEGLRQPLEEGSPNHSLQDVIDLAALGALAGR